MMRTCIHVFVLLTTKIFGRMLPTEISGAPLTSIKTKFLNKKSLILSYLLSLLYKNKTNIQRNIPDALCVYICCVLAFLHNIFIHQKPYLKKAPGDFSHELSAKHITSIRIFDGHFLCLSYFLQYLQIAHYTKVLIFNY